MRKHRRTQHDVSEHLVVCHLYVADSDAQTENFLELELDCRAYLGKFVPEVLSMRDGRRELTGYST
jgi:hypothetical protein